MGTDRPAGRILAKKQIDKFKEAAREVRTDDSEERFDQVLKKVGKLKHDPKIIGEKSD